MMMEDERSEDDFKFDLSKACLKYIKIANLTAEHPLSAPNFQKLRKSGILEILTDLVCDPDECRRLLLCFKPIIAELVGRACSLAIEKDDKIIQCCHSISNLILNCPFLADLSKDLFSHLKVVTAQKEMKENEIKQLMKVYNNLALADSKKFFMHINWNVVIRELDDGNQQALRCLSLAAEFADQNKILPKDVLNQITSDLYDDKSSKVESSANINDDALEEDQRNFGTMMFTSEDVKTNLLAVAGILLPVTKMTPKNHLKQSSFIMTPSLSNAIKVLTFSLTTKSPVIVEGELGTGKTALLEYFALLMGRNDSSEILKLQLGEQTDSKSILGIYICTETPGEFKWQAGTLTKAVKNGSWLILEDIDSAPLDVISVLMPLLEGKPLSIPGQTRDIIPAPGFQIFLTRRLQKGNVPKNAPSKAIEHLCTKVQLSPLSKEEILQIVCKKHPHLDSIAAKLVDVFCMISSDLTLQADNDTLLSNHPAIKRQSTSRDFFKWCQRIAERFQNNALISINIDVFQEAFSCFCVPVGNAEDRLTLAQAIGAKLGLSKDKIDYFVLRNKGNIQQTQLRLTVGRASLIKKETIEPGFRVLPSLNFAFTRHAVNLLEEIAICVLHNEPVLLVGETGCGKTSTIQYLATKCGHKFSAINMSQQSDITDLLGGFKPVDFRQIIGPLRENFERLFVRTFSQKQNVKFLGHVQQCFAEKKWEILLKLMDHCKKAALKRKGLKKDLIDMDKLILNWKLFGSEMDKVLNQLREGHSLAFAFVEGTLVKAIKNGEWILLDEINLATAETLECLSGLLESKAGSVVLVERGDAEPIRRHDDFRLFACMNPATDIGKKDLPFGIRNRFTEIYVDELNDSSDLKVLVSHYLRNGDVTAKLVDGIVKFYELVQKEAKEKLTDGTGHKPHYSLRTLCRALEYAARNDNMILPKAVYEGFCLSFLTQLDRSSHPIVEAMIRVNILGHLTNTNSLLSQPILCPGNPKFFSQVEEYWIEKGGKPAFVPPEYVLTSSVKENLKDLARVVSGRKYPVLLQGETSVGKTSLITYLAKSTGNQCVRINNHEHTDIQEYIGCYSADENGKLVFKDGLLVDAMRKGYWIILDELNLAPTDVLEALNRLLDDNRELFIAETQETIKAHPKFMLFATQNPPGQYGGRKILSRAFRNRFVELHFDEIPSSELQIILHKRCHLPRSYCSKFVAVMHDLQARRKSSGIFAGKHGYITLRDLFRWAERYRQTPSEDLASRFYDWDQHIAEDGYMLLAGRCRKPEETIVIKETIEKVMKRKIDIEAIYKHGSITTGNLLKQLRVLKSKEFEHLVWTNNLQRMAVLVGRAIQFNEPVLLVGDTGCGKTTVCQLYSHLRNNTLLSVNCHMHTESSDFIGGLRPVRERSKEGDDMKLFEWCDGPLVCALKNGSSFLIDEISLADDSVLERLNSVLETEKTLVLAEKGGTDDVMNDEIEVITAHDNFRLMATMNPGGDFGKKELSPALRNRFTEIWCPQLEDRNDFIKIIDHNIHIDQSELQEVKIGEMMMEFVEWFKHTEAGQRMTISIRDLLSWSQFINKTCLDGQLSAETQLSPKHAYIHGAFLVFIDAIGSGSSWSNLGFSLQFARQACLSILKKQTAIDESLIDHKIVLNHSMKFGVTPFLIDRGPIPQFNSTGTYSLTTKTTSENTLRLLRAMQLSRPILLEGSPGVGKTSLVTALAKFSGHPLTRINLSEQTDVTDLFGADLPSEGSKGGAFAWRDGPFLKALKQGQWIVLDELNLASQSVLEGLNACFDHRGEIYVPELGKSFQVQHKVTRIFACQNPLNQGGGRKGLPKSFLNRFTKVYIEALNEEDLMFIIKASYPEFNETILNKMIYFNSEMQKRTMITREWGQKGSPWEFNVRDIMRWCQLINHHQEQSCYNPSEFLNLIYADRMRTIEDKSKVFQLYTEVFGDDEIWTNFATRRAQFFVSSDHVQVGHSLLPRTNRSEAMPLHAKPRLRILRKQLATVESVMKCIEMNWMAVIVGAKASGKTSIVETIAQLTGNTLNTLAMNSNMDTTELLGGFEQVNLGRHLDEISVKLEDHVNSLLRHEIDKPEVTSSKIQQLLRLKIELKNLELDNQTQDFVEDPAKSFVRKFKMVEDVIEKLALVTENYKNGCSKIGELKERFDSLKTRFEDEGMNAHARGQFEWIDGILVKSLKEGDWLLIDNVNFCSPAVLDRLNGLLEPNGVLSIDERGVQNEEIPTVKPHPNFRLFLCMDPKHGEISRAMRNRGIEVFIVAEEEGLDFSTADKLELISSSGLEEQSTKIKLVLFHEEIVKKHPQSVTELVKAAKLTKEMMDRGIKEHDALTAACKQIYTNNQMSMETIEEIDHCMEAVLQSTETEALGHAQDAKDKTEESVRRLAENRILLPSVSEYSQLTLVSSLKRDLSFFQNLNQGEHSVAPAPYACKAFLERSTANDWDLRLQILSKTSAEHEMNEPGNEFNQRLSNLFRGICNSDIFKRIVECLEQLSSAFKPTARVLLNAPVFLHLNRRLHQECFKAAKHVPLLESWYEELLDLCNRIELLQERSMVTTKEHLREKETKRLSQVSLLEISKQVMNGALSSSKLPHAVVELFHPYFKILGKVLDGKLQNCNWKCSGEMLMKLLFAVKWRDRFWNLCTCQTKGPIREATFQKALFAVHWKWIIDYLNPVLAELLSDDCAVTIVKELDGLISAINAKFNEDLPSSLLIGLSIQTRHPPPYQSHDLFAVFSILDAFQQELCLEKLLQHESKNQLFKTWFAQSECEKRANLFQCFVQFYTSLLKDEIKPSDIQAMQTSITMSLANEADDAMPSKGQDDSPRQTASLPEELWLMNGQLNLFLWLKTLHLVNDFDHNKQLADEARLNLQVNLNQLQQFACYHYDDDLKPTAMLSAWFKQETGNQINNFPSYTVPMLRSHIHGMSTFKLHAKLLETINSENEKTNLAGDPFTVFSSTTANVMVPWMIKKVALQPRITSTDGQSLIDIDWTINVNQIDQTKSSLASLLKNNWQHAGLFAKLPWKIWRCMFQDVMKDLLDLLKSLQIERMTGGQFESALNANRNKMLEIIAKELSSESLKEVEVQQDIKNVVIMIGMLAEKELRMSKDKKDADESSVFMSNIRFLGEMISCVALCRFLLNLPRDPYDKAEEAKIKCHYYEEELDEISKELNFRYAVEEYLTGLPKPHISDMEHFKVEHLTSNESRGQLLLRRREFLIAEVKQLGTQIALRPNPSKYDALLKDLKHFHDTIGNHNHLLGLLLNSNEALLEQESDARKPFLKNLQRRIKIWVSSTEQFLQRIIKSYPLYPDILMPIKWTLTMIINGFSFILHVMTWQVAQNEIQTFPTKSKIMNSVEICRTFASFPFATSSDLTMPIENASMLISVPFTQGIQALIANEQHLKLGFRARILHLALSYVECDVTLRGFQCDTAKISLSQILQNFHSLWLDFFEERRRKEEEDDSFYKFKARSHCVDSDETENNEKSFTNLFPKFDRDFHDLIPKDTLDNNDDDVQQSMDVSSSDDYDDGDGSSARDMTFVDVCQIFDSLKTITNSEAQLKDTTLKRIFLSGYKEFCSLSSLAVIKNDPLIDSQIGNANLLFTSMLKDSLEFNANAASTQFDIYHDNNIVELQKLVPLLGDFSSRVSELLNEFADHPALLQIQPIIDRILSFPVNQPLMKFLTGLEILLKQSQDWESYASSKVSLAEHLRAVTNQVIEWRKLELKCWPFLLDVVDNKFRKEALGWLLKISAALDDVNTKIKNGENDKISSEKEIAKLIQDFLENSTIGEYEARLELIEVLYKTLNGNENDLDRVLWTIYNYYKQFGHNVSEHIKKSKSQIEKDLRDFVNIAKWKDINFYAMKQAADKSHRTLHKFVRKYEEMLNSPVSTHLKLLVNNTDELCDVFKLNSELLADTNRFLASKRFLKTIDDVQNGEEMLNRIPELSSKLVKKCSKYLKKATHTSMVNSLDEFTGDVLSNVKELQSIVIFNLPKEKRATARKHLDLRKRKALATLFKELKNMGLSYRKGLALKSQDESELHILSPIFNFAEPKDQSDLLSILQRDCHNYYFKCLARYSALNNALRMPSKELNPQDVGRFRGYADHLFSIVQNQRIQLGELIKSFEILKFEERLLTKFVDENDDEKNSKEFLIPSQSKTSDCLIKLKTIIDGTIYSMKQFNLLVKCCRKPDEPQSVSFVPCEHLSQAANSHFGDEIMVQLFNAIEEMLERNTEIKSKIDKIYFEMLENPKSFLFSRGDEQLLKFACESLEENKIVFERIEKVFMSEGQDPSETLAKSIYELRVKTTEIINEITNELMNGDVNEDKIFEGVGKSSERLLKGILTCIQELLKMANSDSDLTSKINDDKDETNQYANEENLMMNLEKKFLNDITMIKPHLISRNLLEWFHEIKDLFNNQTKDGHEIALVFPIINQYTKMIQFFVENLFYLHRTTCKLWFVLSGLFAELATKGFCLPPDEEEAAGEGATEFEDIESGGVGEGEGMKDVSDQIESEDQLHGAEQEGKEKEEKAEDDKNIPDEEQGIEMSEDFDGKMHDVDPDEKESESQSDEEDENEEQPDEKMGDLEGMEEEKFDEKFWGDDDDDDDNDSAVDENDKGPGAEGVAESELVAKDENEGEQEGDDNKRDKQQSKDEKDLNELSSDERDEDDEGDEKDNETEREDMKNEKTEPDLGENEIPDDLEFDNDSFDNQNEDGDDEKEEDGDDMTEEEETQEDDNEEDEEVSKGSEEQDTYESREEDEVLKKNEETFEKEEDKDKESSGQDENKADDQVPPSELQHDSSSSQTVKQDETMMQSQNTSNEQQQQQDQGHGSSHQDSTEGRSGVSTISQSEKKDFNNKQSTRKKDYKKSRQDRKLADDVEQKLKKLKTEDLTENKENHEIKDKNERGGSDVFQHVYDDDDDYDAQALDSATKDQAIDQSDFRPEIGDDDAAMDEDKEPDVEEQEYDNQMVVEDDNVQRPTANSTDVKEQPFPIQSQEDEDIAEEDVVTTEEPLIDEESKIRDIQSAYYTSKSAMMTSFFDIKNEADNEALRKELEHYLTVWSQTRSDASKVEKEAVERWRKYENLTSSLPQQLCEQLRLVLEPTLASKLKGDYRTGKRLNMRKVIPYIASQFRKDKIWLRRTKKSRRQYQILLAVDDSSSMGDNHSKQLAFESLAVISNALTWLEAGELAICSFGESTNLLHSFKEPFNEEAGSYILKEFTFEQKKTHIAKMLDTCSVIMSQERSNVAKSSFNRIDTSQLLLIVSDGRGIFLEGKEVVEKSVRRAREAGIFIVFIVLDNPSNRDSILDIKIPVFKAGGGIPEIKAYIDEFPFPFYVILRDINSLPTVLCDALRQWFELVISGT